MSNYVEAFVAQKLDEQNELFNALLFEQAAAFQALLDEAMVVRRKRMKEAEQAANEQERSNVGGSNAGDAITSTSTNTTPTGINLAGDDTAAQPAAGTAETSEAIARRTIGLVIGIIAGVGSILALVAVIVVLLRQDPPGVPPSTPQQFAQSANVIHNPQYADPSGATAISNFDAAGSDDDFEC